MNDRVVEMFLWFPDYLPICIYRYDKEFRWLSTSKVRQRMNMYGEWINICWEG